VTKYICHRSGIYATQQKTLKRQRGMKLKGTNKISCDLKKPSSKYAMKDKDRYDRHVVSCVNSDRFNFRFMIVNLIGY
jgi:hypothetical protein